MARTSLALIALTLIAFAAAPSPALAVSAAQAKPAAPSPAPPASATPAQPGPAAAPTAPSPAPPASAAQAAAATPPSQEAYTYRADGRRDPFLNLVGLGSDVKMTSRKNEGPTGLSLGEISVRGVMQSRGSLVAMIQGPDNKTYIVHQGDKLLDGTIKTVTPQGLVVVQEVNDPLSLIKTREVRKLLRSLEDAKE
jgi:Tfp pilus assembly protein PilP